MSATARRDPGLARRAIHGSRRARAVGRKSGRHGVSDAHRAIGTAQRRSLDNASAASYASDWAA